MERETALRSFRDFEGLVRKAARAGFRLLDCRVINRGDGRPPATLDAIADLVPAAERCLVGDTIVFVPVWKSTSELRRKRRVRSARAARRWRGTYPLRGGAALRRARAGTTGPSPLPMKTTAATRSRRWRGALHSIEQMQLQRQVRVGWRNASEI